MYNELSFFTSGHFLSNFFGAGTGSGPLPLPPPPPPGSAGGYFGSETFAGGMFTANFFRGTPYVPPPIPPAPAPYSSDASRFRLDYMGDGFRRKFLPLTGK